jgi:hypothetical protein
MRQQLPQHPRFYDGKGDHMRYVMLGRTGLEISELGFGGILIIRLDMNIAMQVLRRADEKDSG